MAKQVTKIPATVSKFTASPINSRTKRKVAGYARVSTDHDEQLTSYEAQLDYYTTLIKGHDDWEFAGMYSDEGITGTSVKKREGFQTMVADALAGKIDLIITKSVSRFARNTVDSLSTIRELKEHNTEVYFEKENIWTFDSKGELLITIMSSLAQEESRSISENVTWGHRKRMADGKVSIPFSTFIGYDKGEDGTLVVNPEQAKIIKLIFGEYLAGLSCHAIADKLTTMGIKTPRGKDKWSQTTDKDPDFDENKVGKWMYFFADRSFVEGACKAAIKEGIVEECKHSNASEGVSCFYLNDDDLEGHRRVIEFFIKNDLIRKTKKGKLYNISFKHDTQTLAGEYGDDYHSDIKLEEFVNLETGEWIE